jgi:NAD-dependent deacetylase
MLPIPIQRYKNIVILTGAGISVASGVRPFRGQNGIWNDPDVERFAHIGILETEPHGVWKLFGSLRDQLQTAQPNAAHLALSNLERNLAPNQQLTLVTQNIDGLHQKAGSQNVIEYHGTIHKTKCSDSNCEPEPFSDTQSHLERLPICPKCGAALRPDIVMFGEQIPDHAAWQTKKALRDSD